MTPNKNKDSEKTRECIDYLQDIFESLRKGEEFIQGLEFEEFKKDEKTIFATIRALVSRRSLARDGWNSGQVNP